MPSERTQIDYERFSRRYTDPAAVRDLGFQRSYCMNGLGRSEALNYPSQEQSPYGITGKRICQTSIVIIKRNENATSRSLLQRSVRPGLIRAGSDRLIAARTTSQGRERLPKLEKQCKIGFRIPASYPVGWAFPKGHPHHFVFRREVMQGEETHQRTDKRKPTRQIVRRSMPSKLREAQ